MLVIAVFLTLATAFAVSQARARWGVNDMGHMSEQWLAEYRASHPW